MAVVFSRMSLDESMEWVKEKYFSEPSGIGVGKPLVPLSEKACFSGAVLEHLWEESRAGRPGCKRNRDERNSGRKLRAACRRGVSLTWIYPRRLPGTSGCLCERGFFGGKRKWGRVLLGAGIE